MTTNSSPNPAHQQMQKTILTVHANRTNSETAEIAARDWQAELATTSMKPVPAPRPTELLLGALGACMIAGIEREAQANHLRIDDVQVSVTAARLPPPAPLLETLKVRVTVFSPEPEARLRPILDALETNGTVTNTLKLGSPIDIISQVRSRLNLHGRSA